MTRTRGLHPTLRHAFAVDVARARRIQERLRGRVRETPLQGRVQLVAGVDVSFDRRSPLLHAAVVVLEARTLEVVDAVGAAREAVFPYVPGYLSFREIPPLLDAFARLARVPDLIVCDGHGRAHPRRFGLASHLGVLLDRPTLGCAKSRLVGEHREPGPRRGASVALRHDGETIGRVVRTREGVKPVYASVGHRVTLADAERMVLRLTSGYRLPEPVRAAHAEVNRLRRSAG